MEITCASCGKRAAVNALGLTDLRGWKLEHQDFFCLMCARIYAEFCNVNIEEGVVNR